MIAAEAFLAPALPAFQAPSVGSLLPPAAIRSSQGFHQALAPGAVSAVAAAAAVAYAGQFGSRRRRHVRSNTSSKVRLQSLAITSPGPRSTSGACSCHGGSHLSAEAKAALERICEAIATPGKGITACDESAGTIGVRFEAVGVENTTEHRRLYRQMLFETPGVDAYLSAAILDPETMTQKDDNGVLFTEALQARGIVPGVKPHLKPYVLPGTDGETVMQGLDSLAVRCKEYKAAGAQFAKWRSPIVITATAPSDMVIESNMRDLARYALICQDEGLVPIVEPDIVMKGDFDLETAMAVNVKVQSSLYKAMLEHGVFLEGSILKTNMVNPGLSCPQSYTVEQIAEANIRTLKRVMPVAIRGVNFLSGGQRLEDAAARLSAMNKQKGNSPWNISFSWSAALQFPLFDLCKGKGGAMPLKEMSELYLKELGIASAAAKGQHSFQAGEGAHRGA